MQVVDPYDLDAAIDAGIAHYLVGMKAANGVGIRGTIVHLNDKTTIAIRARIACNKCKKRKHTVYMVSGLHKGAFCYVTDINGNYAANLRDQIITCEKC